jgi:2-dehydro-3-deoxyphosphogluconate aldolase/(4S)-4-hydroxy-2-oxoglutarate aldolase
LTAVLEFLGRTRVVPVDAIRVLSQLPEMVVGAGTVVNAAQVQAAVAAGAEYVVSPGFSREVSRECATLSVPLIPGVMTPTEVMVAVDAGHNVLKFFPAQAAGGAAMLRALAAPFPDVRFVPTGGIGASELADFLSIPAVMAVGGTWVAPRPLWRQ